MTETLKNEIKHRLWKAMEDKPPVYWAGMHLAFDVINAFEVENAITEEEFKILCYTVQSVNDTDAAKETLNTVIEKIMPNVEDEFYGEFNHLKN